MDYDLFWNQDCELVKYYRKAATIKRDMDNQHAWLQGAYVYEAIADLLPALQFNAKNAKTKPYRSEPFPLGGKAPEKVKEIEKKQTEKAKQFMEMFMISNNERFKRKEAQSGRKQ